MTKTVSTCDAYRILNPEPRPIQVLSINRPTRDYLAHFTKFSLSVSTMGTKMRLVKIPTAQVDKAIDTESDEFNTCFHTQLEAPHLSEPTESPTDLHHWLPLIASTQGFSLSSIPIF